MKNVIIETTWKAIHYFEEVEDEEYERIMEAPGNLNSFPEWILEEMDSGGAYLVDWDVNDR